MKITVEVWEKQNMRNLSMKAVGIAVAETLAVIVICYFIKMDKTTMLGVVWLPGLMTLKSYISLAYHQGVSDERGRKK